MYCTLCPILSVLHIDILYWTGLDWTVLYCCCFLSSLISDCLLTMNNIYLSIYIGCCCRCRYVASLFHLHEGEKKENADLLTVCVRSSCGVKRHRARLDRHWRGHVLPVLQCADPSRPRVERIRKVSCSDQPRGCEKETRCAICHHPHYGCLRRDGARSRGRLGGCCGQIRQREVVVDADPETGD